MKKQETEKQKWQKEATEKIEKILDNPDIDINNNYHSTYVAGLCRALDIIKKTAKGK